MAAPLVSSAGPLVRRAPPSSSAAWRRLADMPAGINQHGFEALDGKLYVVSGARGRLEYAQTWAYDIAAGTWSVKASLPQAVQSAVLRAIGGKLYLAGGRNTTAGTNYAEIYEYDPGADSWTEVAALTEAREDMGSAVVGGKLYVFGGLRDPFDATAPLASLEIFDPATYSVSWGANMPAAKWSGDFGAAVDGLIYAVSSTNLQPGYPTLTVSRAVWQYNPVTNAWAVMTQIPVGVCYKEVEAVGPYLYVFGGATANTSTYTAAGQRYDTRTDTWETVQDAPYAALGAGLAVWDNRLYLSGGQNVDGDLPYLYCLEEVRPLTAP